MLKKQVVKKTLMVNKQTWIRNAFLCADKKMCSLALEIILNVLKILIPELTYKIFTSAAKLPLKLALICNVPSKNGLKIK
jgi:hypothetical protein